MRAEEIVGRESFKAWLEAHIADLPRDEAIKRCALLAHRAALRGMPTGLAWALKQTDKVDLTLTLLMRTMLISGVAGTMPTPDMKHSAAAAFAAYAAIDAANSAANAAFSANAAANATNAAYAADAAAKAADAAADAAAFAAKAADAAYAALIADCEALENLEKGEKLLSRPLWPDAQLFDVEWQDIKKALPQSSGDTDMMSRAPSEDWSFWIHWYERALEGRELHYDKLAPILENMSDADWEHDTPAKINAINARFEPILELYRQGERTKLSEAYVFSFEALDRVMRIIGIEDDCVHLREPKVVQRFVDDTTELRDVFDAFVDDARTLSSSQGHGGVAQKAAQGVLNELHRAKNEGHIRARYLVGACKKLERRAKDPETRAELGTVASGDLDDAIELMKDVCRRHFGPSYAAFAPLAQLSFDQVDKDEIIRLVDQALERIKNADGEELAKLHEDDLPLLESMVQELRDLRIQVLSINDDAFREVLERQLAQDVGTVSITLGHYVEKSLEILPQSGKAIDDAGKQLKRVKTMQNIADVLEKIGMGS
ncbi:MAG: hypothetical protein AAGD04_07415 [Pseudomonadota bacterium]